MLLAFGILNLLFACAMLWNTYIVHRFSQPEFFAGLATGCALGTFVLSIAAYVSS